MSRIDELNKLSEKDNIELMDLCGTRIVNKVNNQSMLKAITCNNILDSYYVYSELKNNSYKESLFWEKEPVEQTLYDEPFMKLVDRLLKFGGNSVCIPNGEEEDFNNIMNYGQFWFGKNAKMMIGRPSQCHANSCELYERNKKNTRICTGYAMSQDGIWRQHSWLILCKSNSNQIIETTTKRICYFGFVMTTEQAEEFCYYNL